MLEIQTLGNHAQELSRDFLQGEMLHVALAEKTYRLLQGDDECAGYRSTLEQTKRELNRAQVWVGQEVIHVRSSEPFTSLQCLVRFINLSYRGQYVLVLNDRIIYVPQIYTHLSASQLQFAVTMVARRMTPNRSWWTRLKQHLQALRWSAQQPQFN